MYVPIFANATMRIQRHITKGSSTLSKSNTTNLYLSVSVLFSPASEDAEILAGAHTSTQLITKPNKACHFMFQWFPRRCGISTALYQYHNPDKVLVTHTFFKLHLDQSSWFFRAKYPYRPTAASSTFLSCPLTWPRTVHPAEYAHLNFA